MTRPPIDGGGASAVHATRAALAPGGAVPRETVRALLADAGVATALAPLAPLAAVVATGSELASLRCVAGEAVADFAAEVALTDAGYAAARDATRELARPADAWLFLFARGGDAELRRASGRVAAVALGAAAAFHGVAAVPWSGAALASGRLSAAVAARLGGWFAWAEPLAVVALECRGAAAPALRGARRAAPDPRMAVAWTDDLGPMLDEPHDDAAAAPVATRAPGGGLGGAPPPHALLCEARVGLDVPGVDVALARAGFRVTHVAPDALVAVEPSLRGDVLVACLDVRAVRAALAGLAATRATRGGGAASVPPLLGVSCCAHEDARLRAAQAGAGAFVALPVHPAELARAAHGLIDAARAGFRAPDGADAHDAHAELLRAERMATLGWLAASVGHDLRAPLAAIRSNSELALRALERLTRDPAAAAPSVARALTTLRDLERTNLEAVARLVEIVTGLKAFARGDDATPRHAVLADAVEQALLLCAHELRHARVVRSVPRELPSVAARPVEAMQLVMNLVLNAAQAVAPGGTIEMRAEPAAGGVRLTISDDGPGIDPAVRDQLFRAGTTTKAARGGSGLGLAIVKRIVEACGGTIEVRSDAGAGATFRVVLPCADGAGARRADAGG